MQTLEKYFLRIAKFDWVILFLPTLFIAVLITYILFVKTNLLSDWMFAPIANVIIARQRGHWIFTPFQDVPINTEHWIQIAIENFASKRFATPLFILIAHYMTGINPLDVNHSIVNIVTLLFAIVFLYKNVKNEVIAKIAFLLCSIIIITSYQILNIFYSGHGVYGYIFVYYVFGLLCGSINKPNLRKRFIGLILVYSVLIYFLYHTAIVILTIFFVVFVLYLLVLLILSKDFRYKFIKFINKCKIKFIISCITIITALILLPLFDPLYGYGIKLIIATPHLLKERILNIILRKENVFHPYIGGLSALGKFASIIPPVFLGVLAFPIFLKTHIDTIIKKKDKLNLEDILFFNVYLTGFVITLVMTVYLRPRMVEAQYLFTISVSLILVKYFISKIKKTARFKLYIFLIVLIISLNVISTIVLTKEPINIYRSVHDTQYATANWCVDMIQSRYFADRLFLTLIVSKDPYAKVVTPYFSYKNLYEAKSLYSNNIENFVKFFRDRNISYIVFGKHNYFIIEVPNVGTLKGFPRYSFNNSAKVWVIYANDDDKILKLN